MLKKLCLGLAIVLGERFVPGYKRPSIVDFLLNSPFKE